jgi:hypothetical protein
MGAWLDSQVMASEGMATSIISHKVIDEGRLRTLETAEASSALHRVRHTVEAYTRDEGLRAEDRGDATQPVPPLALTLALTLARIDPTPWDSCLLIPAPGSAFVALL